MNATINMYDEENAMSWLLAFHDTRSKICNLLSNLGINQDKIQYAFINIEFKDFMNCLNKHSKVTKGIVRFVINVIFPFLIKMQASFKLILDTIHVKDLYKLFKGE